MAEPLRQDKARIKFGQIHPGIYVVTERTADTYSREIRSLVSLGNDIYTSSELVGSKLWVPDLKTIASFGDIVSVDYKSKTIRTVLSANAKQNTILVTEECNNVCVFCSQPPKSGGHFYADALLAVTNFHSEGIIGITGGEPTLFWEPFISFLTEISRIKPDQNFHLLTHGRIFSNISKCRELQTTGSLKNLLIGIPLHGHTAELHDKISGVKGSFDETVSGLLNLAFCGAKLEVRIVVNRENYRSISSIIEFVRARLRTSGTLVAVMQLEPAGWAKNRYDELYVSADEQSDHIDKAINTSIKHGNDIVLFNYPLCHLSPLARQYAAKSISDWKNYFPTDCDMCTLRTTCGGFFSSARGSRIENPRPQL